MNRSVVKTPEALLAGLRRKDSKNALTTCFGITASGRPCRRDLPAAVSRMNEAAFEHDEDEKSTVATVIEENELGSEVVAFYCWQHKDQAALYHTSKPKRVMTVKTRNSLEDMLSSMGLEDDISVQRAFRQGRKHPVAHPNQTRRHMIPPPAHNSDQENHVYNRRIRADYQHRDYEPRRRQHKQPSLWSTLFGCFDAQQSESKSQRPVASQPTHSNRVIQQPRSTERPRRPSDQKLSTTRHRARGSSAPGERLNKPHHRPLMRGAHSQPLAAHASTNDASTPKGSKRPLSADNIISNQARGPVAAAQAVIPSNASLALGSALMAEMAKISEDTRSGYIYIYWLAGADAAAAADDDGESLLSGPPPMSPRPDGRPRQKLLLKVGRAENVHRRLSQWSLQCGRRPLLVACHPRPEAGIKARHLHRVERLIHTELRELNTRVGCAECGREHREWFEVAGREGVRDVDRVVRKWVRWANMQA